MGMGATVRMAANRAASNPEQRKTLIFRNYNHGYNSAARSCSPTSILLMKVMKFMKVTNLHPRRR